VGKARGLIWLSIHSAAVQIVIGLRNTNHDLATY